MHVRGRGHRASTTVRRPAAAPDLRPRDARGTDVAAAASAGGAERSLPMGLDRGGSARLEDRDRPPRGPGRRAGQDHRGGRVGPRPAGPARAHSLRCLGRRRFCERGGGLRPVRPRPPPSHRLRRGSSLSSFPSTSAGMAPLRTPVRPQRCARSIARSWHSWPRSSGPSAPTLCRCMCSAATCGTYCATTIARRRRLSTPSPTAFSQEASATTLCAGFSCFTRGVRSRQTLRGECLAADSTSG